MLADVIAFSHLRWDFVHQHPQRILGRLASGRRVFFFEEPVPTPGDDPFLTFSHPQASLTVCRPHLPAAHQGFGEGNHRQLRRLLSELLQEYSVQAWLAWFHTPMALPLIQDEEPLGIIYDCMDERSPFRGAPPGLPDREAELLERADLVLTRGRSLHLARKDRHPNIHCFPGSVDREQLRTRAEDRDPPEQEHLPCPRLGFFGVIDEGMDLELLGALADDRPDWHIVMVGPVAKIDPDRLPLRHNLHWLGEQPYERLPDFVAGWDVCLLPFALNRATRFTIPAETLEYMVAERPVVSTPILAVAAEYGDVVAIASTPEEFVLLCQQALERSAEERAKEIPAIHRILGGTSWASTVEQVEALVQEVERGEARALAPGRGMPPPGSSPLELHPQLSHMAAPQQTTATRSDRQQAASGD